LFDATEGIDALRKIDFQRGGKPMTDVNRPPRPFFTVMDIHNQNVITGLIQGDVWTVAKDEESLSLPLLIALDFAAETIRAVLDENGITNCHGLSLEDWLGDDTTVDLRNILSKITGPEPPNFTTPHGSPKEN
jgi:hypothetical protein